MPESIIISPEVGCESFTVAGVTYTRTEGICLGRARLLQRFQTELQYDMSIPAVQQGMMAVAADLNGNKLLDGLHKFGKLLDGLDILGQNRFRQAEILALFYNAPGEDSADSSYALVQQKVAAWGAVEASFFTRTAYWLLLRFWQACQPAPEGESGEPSPPGSLTA